jgi:hypothetical protein
MLHALSSCWALDGQHKTDYGARLCAFANTHRVESLVLLNLLAPVADPASLLLSDEFRSEVDEDSALARHARHGGGSVTWVLGHGDRVLCNKRFADVRRRIENAGVRIVDTKAPVLDRDALGEPTLAGLVLAMPGPALVWHWPWAKIPPVCTVERAAEDAAALIGPGVRAVVDDLPGQPSYARLGSHAGRGIWHGRPGGPGYALLLDAEDARGARMVEL